MSTFYKLYRIAIVNSLALFFICITMFFPLSMFQLKANNTYETPTIQAKPEANTPILTITHPVSYSTFTSNDPFSAAVIIEYDPICSTGTGCLDDGGKQIIDLSLIVESADGDSKIYPIDITYPLSTAGQAIYFWVLPYKDYIDQILIAKAENRDGNIAYSPPITVRVDTVLPTAPMPLDTGKWSPTNTLVFSWTHAYDGSGIAQYNIKVTSRKFEFINSLYVADLIPSDGIVVDLTPPIAVSSDIIENSSYLHVNEDVLYYFNNMPALTTHIFQIGGVADDQLSGLQKATFSSAFGDAPVPDLAPAAWQVQYDVRRGDTGNGKIVVTLHDNAGQTTPQTFTYQLDNTPPTSQIITVPFEANVSKPVSITWQANDNQSGVYSTTLWYRKVGMPQWMAGPNQKNNEGTFLFDFPDGWGTYLLSTVAVDQLGNLEIRSSAPEAQVYIDSLNIYMPFIINGYPHTEIVDLSVASDGPTAIGNITKFSASVDEGAGVQYTWDFGDDTFGYDNPITHTYSDVGHYPVVVTASNKINYLTATTSAYIYFPLLNGDFEIPTLAHWTGHQGTFDGHGSGLPQFAVVGEITDTLVAQIGSPEFRDANIPIGHGSLQQSFTVLERYLQIWYRVFTHDVVKGVRAETQDYYFDSFEVSINVPPDQISNEERNRKGCSDKTAILNPHNRALTIIENGLAFCGGYQNQYHDNINPALQDLGWRRVHLDLLAFQGSELTLYLTLWSREDDMVRLDDTAYFNTWVLIDGIALTNQPPR